ncbi:bifunctional glutamate--cysteine ligase GshA/glutathione synthetase GshB [Isobaculum melis]|uniref:Glutathione biosynthesis bifunctional protein GshAB n=1 Tax=Isobaculum melis TaxID=142588 RepID=A0A1H9RKB3_9LACT|nr:bifunctional glutamate--cysteine ligase GshA/glutathione synthetase GshB [Isobaculum melis]SER73104.1 glutamate-cysteine ligase /glutathione synthase [Isobaculum melis]
MKHLQADIKKLNLFPAFSSGQFGMEKEGLRITKDGHLSLTPHPSVLGNRSFHPYIQTDFSESQLELITSPAPDVAEMYRRMMAIHDVAGRSLATGEAIWPASMPAIIPAESEIPIAKLDDKEDVLYREALAAKYGKAKQLVSGIHYNFELGSEFVEALYQGKGETGCIETFKTSLYLKMAQNFLRYRWVLTYLLGATPIADESFWRNQTHPMEKPQLPVRSIRNSHLGYSNDSHIAVSFESLEKYVSDIERLVANGDFIAEKEFYSPIRFRGSKSVRGLLETGIRYIEIRVFDLNPFAPFGMTKEDMAFVHLFMLYMLWIEELHESDAEASLGHKMNETTALEQPDKPSSYQAEAMTILAGMEKMSAQLALPTYYEEALKQAKEKLVYPEKTLANQLIELIQSENGFISSVTALAEQYEADCLAKPYALRGYTNMELSTQLLLFDAIQKGITAEVIDEHDQFLKLQYHEHIEYVKNANMTSKDQYIAPLIMENKSVTKRILEAAGFHVPAGEEYQEEAVALANYWRYQDKAIVVKPKSTNYGLGISIFKEGPSLEDYTTAIKIAFKEDQAVLVEEYVTGTEYRFFVLDGKVEAIMLRVPANVIGDGKRTITDLVAEKNQDILRGSHHRSPLELIQLGEIEQLMLKEQGYQISSIPQKGEIVYLRENSNVSTGGDSIDKTDEIDVSYKQAAIEMTAALGARVSGVDLIIPDATIPSTKEHPGYAVIEANFNPAMHMHAFPYQGKGRRLTLGILGMLFPELIIKEQP